MVVEDYCEATRLKDEREALETLSPSHSPAEALPPPIPVAKSPALVEALVAVALARTRRMLLPHIAAEIAAAAMMDAALLVIAVVVR